MQNKYYRIYAKTKDMTRYQALDVGQGAVVGNLIYATVYTSLESANNDLKWLVEDNDSIAFKVVKV